MGAFVVLSADGLFWDGEFWTPRRLMARRFSGVGAYADCALAVPCLRRLGVRCSVAYLPVGSAPQVEAFELPGADAAVLHRE